MTDYSGPERNTERGIRKRIAAQVIRDRGCCHCKHRQEAWGNFMCSLVGRKFPQCETDGRALVFELDESTIRGDL